MAHWRAKRSEPLRVEFVVTDHCNLNCRGCTHYSPIVPEEYADHDQLLRSMEHIAAACGDSLEEVYLIGGETLLYPRLCEAMRAMRCVFPSQRIYVFTNGLLLPRMSEEFWKTVVDERVIIAMTRYPVKFDYDAAEQLCRDRGAQLEVFADRSGSFTFFRNPLDPSKRQNGRLRHFKCFNSTCLSVVGSRLYPCSISGCVSHLNRRFGTSFTHCKGDYIEVSDIRSASQLRRLRNNPTPFCSYCCKPQERPHAISRREAEEWVKQPNE